MNSYARVSLLVVSACLVCLLPDAASAGGRSHEAFGVKAPIDGVFQAAMSTLHELEYTVTSANKESWLIDSYTPAGMNGQVSLNVILSKKDLEGSDATEVSVASLTNIGINMGRTGKAIAKFKKALLERLNVPEVPTPKR